MEPRFAPIRVVRGAISRLDDPNQGVFNRLRRYGDQHGRRAWSKSGKNWHSWTWLGSAEVATVAGRLRQVQFGDTGFRGGTYGSAECHRKSEPRARRNYLGDLIATLRRDTVCGSSDLARRKVR